MDTCQHGEENVGNVGAMGTRVCLMVWASKSRALGLSVWTSKPALASTLSKRDEGIRASYVYLIFLLLFDHTYYSCMGIWLG